LILPAFYHRYVTEQQCARGCPCYINHNLERENAPAIALSSQATAGAKRSGRARSFEERTLDQVVRGVAQGALGNGLRGNSTHDRERLDIFRYDGPSHDYCSLANRNTL